MSLKSKAKFAIIAVVAATGGAVGATVAFKNGWTGSFMANNSQRPGTQSQMEQGHNTMPMASAAPATGQGPEPEQLYHCGMHPWIIMDHPGNCPICHMALTPIQGAPQAQVAAGGAGPEVIIDPAVVQNMGVQTAQVMKGPLIKTVRAVGVLDLPESASHDITLKINGWIDKLYADTTGMHIHKGQPLFDLYSPDLIVAQEELIAVEKSLDGLNSASPPEIRQQAQQLVASARRKLELWDIPDSQIDAIAKLDHAQKTITFYSPVEGHLQEKMIVQGTAVAAGMNLMRIADHSNLWLNAKVYEENLSMVELGQEAEAILDGVPGKTFKGKVTFISPHVDHMTRTTDVRIELPNLDFALKPGMYATVLIHTQPVANTLWVPREAVIDTGTRQVVFVVEPEGHFAPRLVTMGLSGDDDRMEILKGLAPGETVVTSGQFLLDVESRTNEAVQKMLSGNENQPQMNADERR